jgi:hypothetical protein
VKRVAHELAVALMFISLALTSISCDDRCTRGHSDTINGRPNSEDAKFYKYDQSCQLNR